MTYDEFMKECHSKGLDPFEYLMPSESFEEIIDDSLYGTKDIKDYIMRNERTARRWCNSGYIKVVSKNPWLCTGLELKRTLFKEFHDQIMTQFLQSGKKNIM
ncbi:hypothetical protein [Bacillus sp. ISL-39]|uniref:hypothetical protein n=1 Tax=Bacillus sp. ISL-39 TaxID=2819124 RepID=UPI001BEB895B|nr:hypothetical protein [Bacillus sp. ISL-39]MBT2636433.1 hypothetical protein [Bacillus sp. ISL-39]